ncbi:MAG: hypothetical protein AABY65_04320 [Nitrospirota bacterium]
MPEDYWFWKFLAVLILVVVVGLFAVPEQAGNQADTFLAYLRKRSWELAKVYLLLVLLGFAMYLYVVFTRRL